MAKPLRILILEDNQTDSELVQFELKEAGFTFTSKVVTTEEDFICELQEFLPDLILSDYDLPQYNGALALAEAKKRCPDTPFILVTGAVTEGRAIEILTQGAKDYVLKTLLQQRLVPAVERALAEAEEHRARKQAEAELREAHRTLEERVKIRMAELEAEMAARKEMEEALQESETNYRELVENANSIIIRMDQYGILTFVNEFAHKFFGYTREELIGVNVKIIVPPSESTGRNLQAMADTILRNPDDYIENINENIRKNGERVWISWRNKGIRDSHGNIIGNLAIGQDITDLKRAEESLRESERRLALAASSTHIGMFDWDLIKRRVLWTQTHDAIFGYAPATTTTTTTIATTAEYDIRRWADRVHPDDLPLVEEESRRCMLMRKPLEVQYRVIWPDGSLHWVETRGVFLQDSEGKDNRMLGVVMDITECKQAEEEIRQQREWFHVTLASIGDAVISTDDEGRITFMNSVAEALTGWPFHEASGRPVIEIFRIINEYTRKVVESPVTKVLKEGVIVGLANHTLLVRRDGTEVPIDDSGAPIRYVDGTARGVVLVFRDITERKRADEALQKRERLLQDVIDGSTSPIFLKDIDGRFITINASLERMLGITREEIKGKTDYDIAPRKLADYWRTHDKKVMETGKAIQIEELADLPDGHHIFLANKFPLIDAEGRVYGVGAISHDITERKRAEIAIKEQAAHLEDVNKELESFSYSVSHDLKAPLRAIDGYSRILVKKYGNSLDEDAARMVKVIRDNTKRMGILIDDLLSFSKVLKSSAAISEIDMNKLVKDAWNEIRELNSKRKFDFKVTDMLPVKGDLTLIKQVIVNLISNAVKFTKTRKKGIIEVSSYSENSHVFYCIKDNGVGFDMAYYDKLFGVFQRLHSREEYEGTGVGLAIVHRIINRHGGRVWAEGEVDKGATFFFSLPVR